MVQIVCSFNTAFVVEGTQTTFWLRSNAKTFVSTQEGSPTLQNSVLSVMKTPAFLQRKVKDTKFGAKCVRLKRKKLWKIRSTSNSTKLLNPTNLYLQHFLNRL